MSVFDPFHHDHINTPRKHPLITPFELQMVGGRVSHENWGGGVITPLGGLDKSLSCITPESAAALVYRRSGCPCGTHYTRSRMVVHIRQSTGYMHGIIGLFGGQTSAE